SFAGAAARLVSDHTSQLRGRLSKVSSLGDRTEAHEARIAAKRLRYLLEPLTEAIPAAAGVVEDLRNLQDALGELHDAQLFGSELAGMISSFLADSSRGFQLESEEEAAERGDPIPGLEALARRLRRAEREAFDRAKSAWLDTGASELLAGVSEVEEAL